MFDRILDNIERLIKKSCRAWIINLIQIQPQYDILNEVLRICTYKLISIPVDGCWPCVGDTVYFRFGNALIASGTIKRIKDHKAVISIDTVAKQGCEIRIDTMGNIFPDQEWMSWSEVLYKERLSYMYKQNCTNV